MAAGGNPSVYENDIPLRHYRFFFNHLPPFYPDIIRMWHFRGQMHTLHPQPSSSWQHPKFFLVWQLHTEHSKTMKTIHTDFSPSKMIWGTAFPFTATKKKNTYVGSATDYFPHYKAADWRRLLMTFDLSGYSLPTFQTSGCATRRPVKKDCPSLEAWMKLANTKYGLYWD